MNEANNKNILSDYIKQILRSDNNKNNLLFLTLRFRYLYNDIEDAKKMVSDIMSAIYKKMLGSNWKNKLCNSVYIIEHGRESRFHVHMIINIEDISLDKFKKAIDRAIVQCPWCNLCYDIAESDDEIVKWHPLKNHLLIRGVWCINDLINYLLKEYDWNKKNIDFNNLFLNNMLFD